jgi:hypothetical protein
MRLLVYTLFALNVFCAVSCKKESTIHPAGINGKWRWVKSVGGIAGSTLTPQSTGNNFRDEFYADSTFKRFENDSLISQGRFSIIKNFNYTPSYKIDVLKIGSSNSGIIIRNDTLYMTDLFISDGFDNTYVRMK